jgi:tetratricopeptide (TPR) repeat protein
VAVLAFENRTGESSFDYLPDMTRDWIVHGLAQTGMIEPVVFQPITSRMRGVPVLSRREDADQAAGRAGSTVRGAIYLAGATLRFEGTVTTSRGGLAWTLRSVTAPLDSPEQALREVSDRLTGAIAVLANPRFASWLPLGTTTPPTFDAFEEFARGDELQLSGRARDALAHFTRAASLDTTFTWSLVQAAFANLNMLDNAAADSIATSLKRERERLTPLELAWLDWIVAVIQEDEEEANRAITVAADMAPDRFLSMRAETLRWLNRPAEIVKILRPFGPGSAYHRTGAPYWNRIAESYHHLGQHRRELAVARRMRNHPPSRFEGLRAEIRALAALGRTSEVLSRLDDVESLPRGSIHSAGSILLHAAEELRAHGHLDPAAAILARSIDWYQGLPADEARRLNNRFELARALYLAGRLDEAESAFRQLAVDDPVYLTEYQGSIGAIAARRGDRETAESFVSMLERQRLAFDQPPKYAIFAQARIVALLGDSKRAVRMLREALGGQGRDLHMDADFEMLISDLDFKAFIRPKG